MLWKLIQFIFWCTQNFHFHFEILPNSSPISVKMWNSQRKFIDSAKWENFSLNDEKTNLKFVSIFMSRASMVVSEKTEKKTYKQNSIYAEFNENFENYSFRKRREEKTLWSGWITLYLSYYFLLFYIQNVPQTVKILTNSIRTKVQSRVTFIYSIFISSLFYSIIQYYIHFSYILFWFFWQHTHLIPPSQFTYLTKLHLFLLLSLLSSLH